MVIYVLIGIGIVLFTLGASFVLKAYLNTPNDNTIVPKPEFDKIKLELTQTKESEAKLIGQVEQLIKDLEAAKQDLGASKTKEETVLKNLQEWQAKTTSNEEVYKTTIHQLETELNLLREKAETQARGALEMATSLKAENESLKGNPAALKLKDQELEKARELLKALTAEQEGLKSDLASSRGSLEELTKQKDQFVQLTFEKESLAKDLETARQKLQELNTALLAKQEALSYELTKNQAENKYDEEKKEARNRIAGLENEKTVLLSARTELKRDLEKVKEINAVLLKKEEMIQYELTKARAQAMGLEKVAEEFKTEIEKQLQEISALKSENSSLRKLQEAKG